jgi:hypothetical protein
MENNTPPISKAQRALRLIVFTLILLVPPVGIFLFLTSGSPAVSFASIGLAAVAGIFLAFACNTDYYFRIEFLEYRVVKIKTQSIGLQSVMTEKISFNVQQKTYGVIRNEFNWITIETELTEEEAIRIVDNKFVTLSEPVEEEIYRKP